MTIKTRWDVIDAGYDKHHESYHRGYVSRRADINTLPAIEYSGKFGSGFVVDTPCYSSTQYWIKDD